jgi:hypothetical protein
MSVRGQICADLRILTRWCQEDQTLIPRQTGSIAAASQPEARELDRGESSMIERGRWRRQVFVVWKKPS